MSNNDAVPSTDYFDVTAELTPETIVYPGDPKFHTEQICTISDEHPCKLEKLSFCNHTGTHIDFPAHVIRDGKTSSDYALSDLILDGMVVEVPVGTASISADFVSAIDCASVECIFFKTSNSKLPKTGNFCEDYVYVEPEAAKVLVNKQLKVVGIDYLSVDAFNVSGLPVHQVLLGNEILIVENLCLGDVLPGRYKVFIMPLKVPDMDGCLQEYYLLEVNGEQQNDKSIYPYF